MSRTPDTVSADIRAKLKMTLPQLSMEIGTPERKIVDAVSEAISEAYIEQYINGSLLDINSKAGLELEQFVGIFGFGRLQGRQATGTVVLNLTTAATQVLQVPLGTQFYASDAGGSGKPLYFASTERVVIPIGATSASVPVQCTITGTIGNVPAQAIDSMTATVGAASGTNQVPLTGGTDVETDEQLRTRFKATLLRNIAGTEDFYLALCLQSKYTTRAKVFGPVTTYRTQMVVPASGATANVTPAVYDIAYTWPESSSVYQNIGTANERFFQEGIDYEFSKGAGIPTLKVLAGGALAATGMAGQIIDVEFEYTTKSSRNNPNYNSASNPYPTTNAIDIFVDGVDPYSITEANYTSNIKFDNAPESPYYYANFERGEAPGVSPGDRPSINNYFMRLGSGPVVDFPAEINIGAANYKIGVHYWLVRGTTKTRGSQREVFGIEWVPPGAPGNGPVQSPPTQMMLNYSYNRLPEVLDAVATKAKQICTNVLIHEAQRRFLKVVLAVEYNRGYDPAAVNSAITLQLRQFFGGLGFGAWVQKSDIELVVHQVLGVDNVRIATSADAATTSTPGDFGVMTYAWGTNGGSGYLLSQLGDFKLGDAELPVFLSAKVYRKPTL